MALAVRTDAIDRALAVARGYRLVEHWRDTSADGISFVMCRDGSGFFVLLYEPLA